MTTLDHRLYAWLLESDERRFEIAFSHYFAVAYPAVMGRIARLSKWDAPQLEELAQDALFKFFERVGRGRREASICVENALAGIHPLEIGALHERQVVEWTRNATAYRAAAMNFRPQLIQDSTDTEWKLAIRTVAARIPALQTQGWHLIEAVRLKVLDLGETDPMCAERLATEVVEKTALTERVERHLPGATKFVECAFKVIDAIPRLQIPTNAYLFEISDTLYLDECRKRGRQKRGGRGVKPDKTLPAHPLELLNLEPESGDVGDEFEAASSSVPDSKAVDATSCNPIADYESEEFLEKFCEYLRTPVDRAAEVYEIARTRGLAVDELNRFNSLSNRFSRAISVLAMLGEGFTQEQAADRLSLSRNQVKYAVELVQRAYAQFAESALEPAGNSVALGVSA